MRHPRRCGFIYPNSDEGNGMATRVAINGFGRTGRCTFRAAFERNAGLEVVAINDVADAELLAHLLRHDSVFGRFPGEVRAVESGLTVDGREIAVFGEADPAQLPWERLGVDVAIESTGRFRT